MKCLASSHLCRSMKSKVRFLAVAVRAWFSSCCSPLHWQHFSFCFILLRNKGYIISCLAAWENSNFQLTSQFPIKIDLIFLCGVLFRVSVVCSLQSQFCLVKILMGRKWQNVNSFFPALEQHGFKNSDCIFNSVTVLKRSKLYSVVASMIVLPWKDVGWS